MKKKLLLIYTVVLIGIFFSMLSCTTTSDNEEEQEIVKEEEEEVCSKEIYQEKDGIVKVDFESIANTNGWTTESLADGYEGSGYIVWKGAQKFGDPGNNTITYKIKIINPGKYRFQWRSRIIFGTKGTEHNDTWLRFPDASDFYGEKNSNGVKSLVYPKGSLYPIPEGASFPKGASAKGWFKVYLSKLDRFDYASTTSDNDGHAIFIEFDNPGIYKMEISVRSSYHALDRFILFKQGVSRDTAINGSTALSELVCE